MTVVIGAIDTSGKVWIASDRRCTFSMGGFVNDKAGKWVNFNNRMIMAFAGSARINNVMEVVAANKDYVRKQKFSGLLDMIRFMDDCKLTLSEADLTYASEDSTGHPVHQNQIMMATKTDIFLGCGDFSVIHGENVLAIGSGADFALGAFYTQTRPGLSFSGIDPEEMEFVLTTCIEAAATFDSGCGPEANIICVSDLPEAIKEKSNANRNPRKTGSRKGRGSKDNPE